MNICTCKCTSLWLLWTYISNLYHMRPPFWDVYFYLHWQYEFIWTPFNKGTIWSWGGYFKLRKMYLSSQRWKKKATGRIGYLGVATTTVSLTFKRHSSQISGTVALWKNEAKAVEHVVPTKKLFFPNHFFRGTFCISILLFYQQGKIRNPAKKDDFWLKPSICGTSTVAS